MFCNSNFMREDDKNGSCARWSVGVVNDEKLYNFFMKKKIIKLKVREN